jgi:hypothetical protein
MAQGNLRFGQTNNEANDPTVLTGTVTENLSNRRAAFKVQNRTAGNPSVGGAIVGEVGLSAGEQADAPAVEGYNGDGDGVLGTSGAHSGVHGIGPTGLRGETPAGSGQFSVAVQAVNNGQGLGVQAFANSPFAAVQAINNGQGLGVQVSSNGTYAAAIYGDVYVAGQFYVSPAGGKHTVMPHPDGTSRLLYCLESAEAWFEDFGRSELSDGRARVELDVDYAALIEADDYHVFVTPEGDSRGVYVTERDSTGFVVQEQQGGRGSVAFSYRIAARPRNAEKRRLARLDDADLTPPEFMDPNAASPQGGGVDGSQGADVREEPR